MHDALRIYRGLLETGVVERLESPMIMVGWPG